jgi:nicotinamidase-related amidase
VLDAARAADVPVVLVSVQFRPGYPEVSPCNKVFSAAAAAGRLQQQSAGAALHAQLHTVAARDIHVTKRRVGAFFGTDLQVVLSGLQTRHLVLLGVRTAGCVLSTVRHAADADFAISVVEDCCADADEEAHSVLLRKVFPWQAEVTTSTALVAALKDNASA